MHRVTGRFGMLAKLWAWIGINKDQLTIVFALVAAVWALSEYRTKVANDKQAETAKFMERYYGATYLNARLQLNTFLFTPESYKRLMEARKGGGKELEGLMVSGDLLAPILTLSEAYESLAVCVNSNQCSKDAACLYFSPDILALHHLFRTLFTQTWKEMWGEEFMKASVELAKSCK
jgi:hypothetical protein